MEKNATNSAIREYAAHEIVPKEGRHVGFMEYMMTWAGGALQPTVWTLGGTLICAGFLGGSAAALLGLVAATLFMGLLGLIGYHTGASSTGVYRFALGLHGGKLISIFAFISQCGWVAIGNYVGAISISYILNALFGLPAYGESGSVVTMIIGILILTVFTYLGIVIGGMRTLKAFESVMMIVLLVFAGLITIILFKNLSWNDIISFSVPEEAKMSFAGVFNLVFVCMLAFATVVNDTTRYVKSAKTALFASMIGATVAGYWFYAMGMGGVIAGFKATGVFSMDNANPATLLMELGLGNLGLPLLLVVVFAIVTTNMLDFYSSALNIQNLFNKVNYRVAVTIVAVLCFAISMIPVFAESFYGVFYSFLNLLGAIFPPLFTIILVDYFIIRKCNYATDDVDNPTGAYCYTKGFNVYSIIAWVIGAIVYTVFSTNNIAGNSIGYGLASMAVTAIVYFGLAQIAIKKNYYKL